jgi:hypothetical protein
MPHLARIVPLLALLAAAPALAQERQFEAMGEIRFHAAGGYNSGASFDQDRIVGPNVNLTRREDGSWAGDLVGQDLSLHLEANRLTGPNVSLAFTQKGSKIEVEGIFFNRRVRLALDPKRLKGRFGACSLDLVRKGSAYRGDMGCSRGERLPASGKAAVQLMGEAAGAQPPVPQLGLALIAVLPS